jgi:hypothetical protein
MDGNAFSTDLEVTDLEDPDEEGWLTVNHHENNSTPQLTHGGTQSLAMGETENAVQRQLEYYMDRHGARVAYVFSHGNVTTFRRPAISQLDIPETGEENTSSLTLVESDFTEDDNALDYSITSLSPQMDLPLSAPQSPFVMTEFHVEMRDELTGGNNSEENKKDEETEDKLN